jgi:hypothetical protein
MLNSKSPEILAFLTAWHENGRANFTRNYDVLDYDTYAVKSAKDRTKFIACDRRDSGVFLVDRATGDVYSIKGYGRPNRKVGTVVGLTAAYNAATAANREFAVPGYVANDRALLSASDRLTS